MRKFLALAMAAVVVMGVMAVYAGEGCCAGKSKSSAKGASCGDMFSKLHLTDAQKAQIETLKADCRRAASTSERHEVMDNGMAKILTPDQMAQWKTQCDKAMKSGSCPSMNSTKTN